MSSRTCETILRHPGITHTSLPESPESLGPNSDISANAEKHLPQVAAQQVSVSHQVTL